MTDSFTYTILITLTLPICPIFQGMNLLHEFHF